MFCLKCKSKTATIGSELVTLRNGKKSERGTCATCGSKKFRLVRSDSKVTGGDILSTIAPLISGTKLPGQRYPGEMHYPGASFMGPFTRLDLRLNADGTPKPDSLPINRVDEAAYRHDLWYNQFTDTQHRNQADRLMIDEIDSIDDPTPKERLMRAVAKPILLGKSKLGLGLKKKALH